MEDQTHPGLQDEIEEIQLEVNEHTIPGTEHVHVTESDLVKEHRIHRHSRTSLKCSKCNKRFRNPTLLQNHVRLHRGPTVYRCGHCQETFKELNKFLDHRAIHPPLRKRRKAYDNNGFQFGESNFFIQRVLGPGLPHLKIRIPWFFFPSSIRSQIVLVHKLTVILVSIYA